MHNHKKGKTILQGPRDPEKTLWKIEIPQKTKEHQHVNSKGEKCVYNLEELTSQIDIIHFIHLSLFIPIKSTWLKAIKNPHFQISTFRK